ncbi:MAG: rhombosortase [Burkholderiaceae bacterium]
MNDSLSRRGAGVIAWLGVSALLGVGALLGACGEREVLDWQPTLALAQPWRLFSAAAVHYSQGHLLVNLGGLILVAALGAVARVTMKMSLAWLPAWALTHAGLLADPGLAHYGGLSGVLHAGVAIVAVHLSRCGAKPRRRIGAALLCGLVAKLALEFPWIPPSFNAGLGIVVAPLAHVSGALAGLACGIAAFLLGRRHAEIPDA